MNDLRIEYENIYAFVCEAENPLDFAHRMQVFSAVIINELAERIDRERPFSCFSVSKIVDELNEEVENLVEKINNADLLDDGHRQPEIQKDVLFRLLKLNNPILYKDYKYSKLTHKN